jgi:hypothetical protein
VNLKKWLARLSQLVLEVPGASTVDGTVLGQWEHDGEVHQQWRLIRS